MSANQISRRQLLGMSLKAGAVAMTSSFSPVRAETRLKRTPGQVLGPFYPVTKPIDQDADLVMVQGKPGRAQGQVIHVTGRVVTAEGKPVQGARLEIWQANTHGRYAHPSHQARTLPDRIRRPVAPPSHSLRGNWPHRQT
jgi:protocatechuate 3,4-dioxygenase beta subunit